VTHRGANADAEIDTSGNLTLEHLLIVHTNDLIRQLLAIHRSRGLFVSVSLKAQAALTNKRQQHFFLAIIRRCWSFVANAKFKQQLQKTAIV